MGYNIKTELPSTKQIVQVKEIKYGLYRDFVKGLYETDPVYTLIHINNVLKELVPSVNTDNLTLDDKIVIFLATREISISPDLKLKCTCPDTNKPFEETYAIGDLIQNIKRVNSNLTTSNATFSNVMVKHEIDYLKESEISLYIEFLYRIQTYNTIDFLKYDITQRKNIVDTFPANILVNLKKELNNHIANTQKNKIIQIKSPFTQNILLEYNSMFTPLQGIEFIKFLFQEDLNNVYRTFFNMVNYCKFDCNYIDSITPSELQVYWSYHIETTNKNKEIVNEPPTVGGLPSTDLGFN